MFAALDLIVVMEKERELVSRLLDVLRKEREGIINSDALFLAQCQEEKEAIRSQMEPLEAERELAAGGRNLRDLMKEAEGEGLERLRGLQQELKAGAREARSLGRANALLYRQFLALADQVFQEITGLKGRPYDVSGQVQGSPLPGKLVSSSA